MMMIALLLILVTLVCKDVEISSNNREKRAKHPLVLHTPGKKNNSNCLKYNELSEKRISIILELYYMFECVYVCVCVCECLCQCEYASPGFEG